MRGNLCGFETVALSNLYMPWNLLVPTPSLPKNNFTIPKYLQHLQSSASPGFGRMGLSAGAWLGRSACRKPGTILLGPTGTMWNCCVVNWAIDKERPWLELYILIGEGKLYFHLYVKLYKNPWVPHYVWNAEFRVGVLFWSFILAFSSWLLKSVSDTGSLSASISCCLNSAEAWLTIGYKTLKPL